MELQFQNKYVAFIDVLGFSSLVYSNENKRLEDYYESVNLAFNIFDSEKKNIKKIIISDSVILIADDSEEDFLILLKAIQTLQKTLALTNIWIRGGISYGEVCFKEKDGVLVGKGYINAFLLEQRAIFPRVIVDPRILSNFNVDRKGFYIKCNGSLGKSNKLKLIHDYGFNGVIRETKDDALFVSYANKIVVDSVTTGRLYSQTGIGKIYQFLRQNLYTSQDHYPKYLWLKDYFNESLCETVEVMEKEGTSIPGKWLQQAFSDFGGL